MPVSPTYFEQLGFKRAPFGATVTANNPFISPVMKQHLRRLEMAATADKGVLLILGEVGLGKSTLAQLFRARLEELDCTVILCTLLQDPTAPTWLLSHCLQMLHVMPSEQSIPTMLVQLSHYLEQFSPGKQLFFLLDEAQRLSTPEGLLLLHALSTLQSDQDQRCGVVLFGLPSLYTAMQSEPGLAQRIGLKLHVEPLSGSDVRLYIHHRMDAAGGNAALFSPEVVQLLNDYSGGIPRNINTLADGLLMEMVLGGIKQATIEQLHFVAQQLGYRPLPAKQIEVAAAMGRATHLAPLESSMLATIADVSPLEPQVEQSSTFDLDELGFDPMALAAGVAGESMPEPQVADKAVTTPKSSEQIEVVAPLAPAAVLPSSPSRLAPLPERDVQPKPYASSEPAQVSSFASVKQPSHARPAVSAQPVGTSAAVDSISSYDADLDELEALLTQLPKRTPTKTPAS